MLIGGVGGGRLGGCHSCSCWQLSPPGSICSGSFRRRRGSASMCCWWLPGWWPSGVGLWRAWSRTGRHSLARRLDRTAGTGGQILSGYELSQLGRDRAGGPTADAGTGGHRRRARSDAWPRAFRRPRSCRCGGLKRMAAGLGRRGRGGRRPDPLLSRADRDAVAAVYRSVWRPSALFTHCVSCRTGRRAGPLRRRTRCLRDDRGPAAATRRTGAVQRRQPRHEEVLPMFQGREGNGGRCWHA